MANIHMNNRHGGDVPATVGQGNPQRQLVGGSTSQTAAGGAFAHEVRVHELSCWRTGGGVGASHTCAKQNMGLVCNNKRAQ